MEDEILSLLGRRDYVPANVPELLTALGAPAGERRLLENSLRELERTGEVARIKGDRYILPREADLIPGRIQITRQGRGFLTPDDLGLGEIAIPSSGTGTALHEDHVLVRVDVKPRGLRSTEAKDTGTVVRVLERRRTQIVGTLKEGKSFLYVIPDDPRMPHDIYVPPPKDLGRPARPGDKVVVELRQWESRHTNPEGEVTEVLGPPTAEGVDMLAVLRQYDLPLKFPPRVLHEVQRFGKDVTEEDLAGRTDCRHHDVITIDPEDAKDFDDAFYLKRTPTRRWQLWVHVADVSHYVKPATALDEEALKRGNSTYLVDRVIPMLPEALSNELCSLKPKVDRLTKCVEFLISDDGKVLRARFYPAVIHSKRRFGYKEALKVIRGKAGDGIEEMLHHAHKLAQKIRKRRFDNGSLELDFPESKIRLDERGRVERIERMENDESHQLIEEFMLLANEAVAGRLMSEKRPSIYRVHEKPDSDRLRDYREEVLSHNVPCGNLEKTAEVQKLLRRLHGLAIGSALKIGFLKSLMRARYAVEPLGHYGLAKSKYAHFTSPIRRYADLVVHRTLFDKQKENIHLLKKVSDHISSTERNSADAERDSKDVKMHAYLEEQLKSGKPHRYSALVTDIRNFGFFVDVIDLGMSGMVPLSLLEDDFYEFDAARVQVQGRRSRTIYRLGDRVEVEIARIDRFKKQVDFRIAASPGKKKRSRTGPDSTGSRTKSKRSAQEPVSGSAKARAPRNRRSNGDRPPVDSPSSAPVKKRPARRRRRSPRPDGKTSG